MAYDLSEINFRTVSDPKGFMEECDERYNQEVRTATDKIITNLRNSPIVLLSGPSGSGKTTTSIKIAEELKRRGLNTHYVGMDDYYKTVDSRTPRTETGELDLESPLCLDMELLNSHFSALSRGETITVPKYEFARQMRLLTSERQLRLGKDEIADAAKKLILDTEYFLEGTLLGEGGGDCE